MVSLGIVMRFCGNFHILGVTSHRESALQCAMRTDWNLPDSEFH